MNLVKSPLNYTGGKYKLLPQLLPLFPQDINIFVDLFCGGLDISINVEYENIISNDIILPIINLYEYWNSNNKDDIINTIHSIIYKYNLDNQNLDGYLKIRNDYNNSKDIKLLFPIISHCYNNQIRFNSKWGFNRHFGKNRSHFNDNMKKNLINLLDNMKNKNITFTNFDIFDIDFNSNLNGTFYYADPPYLITQADYSIQASWDENKEVKLLNILDKINSKGGLFGLSNVIYMNGKENIILKKWMNKYNTHILDKDYNNSNSVKKNKSKNDTIEVYICNY